MQQQRMVRIFLVVVALLALSAAGCNNVVENARDSIAAAKGFIQKAQQNHLTQCKANPSQDLCQAINMVVAAQNVAIDAVNIACAGADWDNGAACVPTKDGEAKIRAAIRDLDRIIADVKGVVGK